MRNEEEIEPTVLDFGLFDESLVYIGTSRRVDDLALSHMEESLPDSLVNDDQGDVRGFS